MAVIETPISCKAGLLLNKGQDASTGKTITGYSNMNGLAAGADNQKVYDVASLLADCVDSPVIRIYKTETVELEDA